MEEENMALNESVEVENDADTTPVSEAQATEEAEVETTEPAGEEVEATEETESDEKPSKKGLSNRVRELNEAKKEAEAKAESLAEKLAELTSTPEPRQQFTPEVDDSPLVRPGEDIDAVEFDRRLKEREQRVLQRADALVTLRGKQQEAVQRINREADEAIRAYPELDPDSDGFNRELSDAITEATEAYVSKNPYSASVKSFVDKMMRPYKGAVSKEVGDMTAKLTKQVSEAATKPTSVRKKEKPAEEKTIAELEAELGVVQA